METASKIINDLMSRKGFRKKQEAAEYFGVSPQALSIWITKGQIPPKHLLKLKIENEAPTQPQRLPVAGVLNETEEKQTVINYLMNENHNLKQQIKKLNLEIETLKTPGKNDDVIGKWDYVVENLEEDTLFMSGRISDGVITDVNGKWDEILGYEGSQLLGLKYDRKDLMHHDELARTKNIQKLLKASQTIKEIRYSTIQRWKHGITGKYVVLSMVAYVNMDEDRIDVVAKSIENFFYEEGLLN